MIPGPEARKDKTRPLCTQPMVMLCVVYISFADVLIVHALCTDTPIDPGKDHRATTRPVPSTGELPGRQRKRVRGCDDRYCLC